MNTKENEEFIDGLQGKIYVSVIIDYSTKPKVSERMTLEEAKTQQKDLSKTKNRQIDIMKWDKSLVDIYNKLKGLNKL